MLYLKNVKIKFIIYGCALLLLAITCFSCWQDFYSARILTSYPQRSATGQGRILNIYCWNQEFKERLEAYYPAYDKNTRMIGDIKVNWFIFPNKNNIYQLALDNALANQENAAPDDKVDLFLIEADYAAKYTHGPVNYAMDISALGISEAELANQFSYTRQLVTDSVGCQRGIAWQACPGFLLYRRDIAKKVLGTDAPDKVQAYVCDWPTFTSTAARMHQAGFHMLAGTDDAYRAFLGSTCQPWVDHAKHLRIAASLESWLQQARHYNDADFQGSCTLRSPEWDKTLRGPVFCFLGTAWFIDFNMIENSLAIPTAAGGSRAPGNGTYGLWGICRGPQPFVWGGTWLCAASGTDNAGIVSDIMRTLCCNKTTALALAKDLNEFPNNRAATAELAADEHFASAFFNGQNIYKTMAAVIEEAPIPQVTPYDQWLNDHFLVSCHSYITGQASAAAARRSFLAAARDMYPELIMPPLQ